MRALTPHNQCWQLWNTPMRCLSPEILTKTKSGGRKRTDRQWLKGGDWLICKVGHLKKNAEDTDPSVGSTQCHVSIESRGRNSSPSAAERAARLTVFHKQQLHRHPKTKGAPSPPTRLRITGEKGRVQSTICS